MQNIHPLFVHFPISLLLAALALEVLAVLTRREPLRNCATACLVFGALGGLVAMVTGLLASKTVPHPEAVYRIMERHEQLGIAVFILASILSIVRLLRWDRTPAARAVFLAALVVTAGLVSYGGYLGGKMVYEFGTGTAVAFVQSGGPKQIGDGRLRILAQTNPRQRTTKQTAATQQPRRDPGFIML